MLRDFCDLASSPLTAGTDGPCPLTSCRLPRGAGSVDSFHDCVIRDVDQAVSVPDGRPAFLLFGRHQAAPDPPPRVETAGAQQPPRRPRQAGRRRQPARRDDEAAWGPARCSVRQEDCSVITPHASSATDRASPFLDPPPYPYLQVHGGSPRNDRRAGSAATAAQSFTRIHFIMHRPSRMAESPGELTRKAPSRPHGRCCADMG